MRRSAQLEPLKEVTDGWLRADLDAPRKRRHTAKRIHARLVGEYGAAGVSYSAVRDYVAKRRPEIWAAAGTPDAVFALTPAELLRVSGAEVARIRADVS